jgi:hypothetical protein
MVTVLALDPRFAGLNPAEAMDLKGDKIRSTPSFGGKTNPSALCRKILRHVKTLA